MQLQTATVKDRNGISYLFACDDKQTEDQILRYASKFYRVGVVQITKRVNARTCKQQIERRQEQMNQARKKKLTKIIEQLDELRNQIEYEAEAEQEYFDNMPENLQGSERGQRAEEGATELADMATELEDIIETLSGLAD